MPSWSVVRAHASVSDELHKINAHLPLWLKKYWFHGAGVNHVPALPLPPLRPQRSNTYTRKFVIPLYEQNKTLRKCAQNVVSVARQTAIRQRAAVAAAASVCAAGMFAHHKMPNANRPCTVSSLSLLFSTTTFSVVFVASRPSS